jgi:Tfp pilus assembly protein PilV
MRPDDRVTSLVERRGAALLEVLVGLAILLVAGSGLVTLVAQHAHDIRELRRREADTREAAMLLERVARSPRIELAGGRSTASGELRVEIGPLAPSLHSVAVIDTRTGAMLLRTSIYAPDSAREVR